MLQTSCCPFSIGVCAGCWVERSIGGRGGAPANMLGLHRNLSTKQEAPSSCWDTCYLFQNNPPPARTQVLIVSSRSKIDFICKEKID